MGSNRQKRGVVIGSHLVRGQNFIDRKTFRGEPGGTQKFVYTPRLDMVESVIRQSILYFDELVWPKNNLIPVKVPGLEVLEEQGFLKRPDIAIKPPAGRVNWPELERGAYTWQFKQLDSVEPGVWSFAPVGPEIGFWPPQANLDRPAIKIELYNALPVPHPDVHYADILDFRSRRHAELEQLRERLEALYLEIVASGDVPLSKIRALENLDKAITDLAAVIRDGRLRALYKSVDIGVLIRDAYLGAKIAEQVGGSAEYGAITGVAGALYKFLKGHIASPISRAGPLEYVFNAVRENIVDLPV